MSRTQHARQQQPRNRQWLKIISSGIEIDGVFPINGGAKLNNSEGVSLNLSDGSCADRLRPKALQNDKLRAPIITVGSCARRDVVLRHHLLTAFANSGQPAYFRSRASSPAATTCLPRRQSIDWPPRRPGGMQTSLWNARCRVGDLSARPLRCVNTVFIGSFRSGPRRLAKFEAFAHRGPRRVLVHCGSSTTDGARGRNLFSLELGEARAITCAASPSGSVAKSAALASQFNYHSFMAPTRERADIDGSSVSRNTVSTAIHVWFVLQCAAMLQLQLCRCHAQQMTSFPDLLCRCLHNFAVIIALVSAPPPGYDENISMPVKSSATISASDYTSLQAYAVVVSLSCARRDIVEGCPAILCGTRRRGAGVRTRV